MAKKGRGRRRLNQNPKGKGKAGSKWKHGFIPKNAVARQLKAKTYKAKGSKTKRRYAGKR